MRREKFNLTWRTVGRIDESASILSNPPFIRCRLWSASAWSDAVSCCFCANFSTKASHHKRVQRRKCLMNSEVKAELSGVALGSLTWALVPIYVGSLAGYVVVLIFFKALLSTWCYLWTIFISREDRLAQVHPRVRFLVLQIPTQCWKTSGSSSNTSTLITRASASKTGHILQFTSESKSHHA